MSESRRAQRYRTASVGCALCAGLLASAYFCASSLGVPPQSAPMLLYAGIGCFIVAMALQSVYVARKRRLRRSGRPCVNCGYDLRGNTSGICPECGGLAHYKRSRP